MMSSNLLLVSALTAISFMLIGWDNGVIGGLTGSKPWNQTFQNPSADVLSTIVAIYEVGCAVGALLTIFIADILGRKKMLFIGGGIMTIGAVLQCTPFEHSNPRAQMIVARIISGVGMGIINSTAPVLQSEVSPAASRGRYVCAQLSTLNLGIFLTYWVDYATTKYYPDSSFAWRFPIALQIVLTLAIMGLALVVVESPRFLAFKGRNEEALVSVSKILGKPVDSSDVRQRYEDIIDGVAYEERVAVKSWKGMFANDEVQTRRRLFIACSVQLFQQLGGINGVIYYAVFVFSNSLGFDSSTASLLSGLLFTWFFVASFIPWFLIDTIGRKKLLLGSISVMVVCFAGLSGVIHQVQYNASNARSCGIGAAALAFIYLGAFTIGFQATVWVLPSETLPLKIRAKGTALATFSNWIINFAVVEIFPISITNIGWRTYLIFMVFNLCFLPVIYFVYKETKGLTLEEIDLMFSKHNHGKTIHEAKMEGQSQPVENYGDKQIKDTL